MSETKGQTPSKGYLRDVKRHITTHDASGKAVIHSSTEGDWTAIDNDKFAFNLIYTTSKFPPSLNEEEDIVDHEKLIASKAVKLVNPNGTTLRMVDTAPGAEVAMHRTQSLDYGIVISGSMEMKLDDGSCTVMLPGDVAIQRATRHSWRNPSETEWTRMIFVAQDCEEVRVGDKVLKEDLGGAL
ncbi:cupin domain protein [Xylogone sp. PMI_703]|nr:cupin domain protein [Xylogone sp. PMI_703]